MSQGDTYNIDLATRQVEINEWSYNNKMETLFVFQIVFISLLLMSLLFYLKSTGLVGGSFVWYVFLLLVLIVGLIIINRAVYTATTRDGRYWNRRRFADNNSRLSPIPAGQMTDYLTKLQTTYTPTTSGGGTSSDGSCVCPPKTT
jgi:FlaA1/EpsC-like NDP-sugar epimerase